MSVNLRKKTVPITFLVSLLILLCIYPLGGCRGEPETPQAKIGSITFDKEKILLRAGDETTVKVTVKPDEAKQNEKIQYTSVNEGIIEIKEISNDGFIVKGLKTGSTVVMAKSELITAYLEVTVESENIAAQYINVAQPVIEILEGERKSTQVSLYGGSVLDNNDFVWRLENGKNNIGISVTGNIAVVSGLERGNQKIIISHPKTEYESEILVFVKGVDEVIKYISSENNVILVPNDGQYHDFSVMLVNGTQEEMYALSYTVVAGNENIELAANNNVCNVKGLKSGTALIKVTHPQAVVEFEVRAIIYDESIPFITLDKTFVLLSIGESVNIEAGVENAGNAASADDGYLYEVISDKDNIVEVIQTNNNFYVRAMQGGNARIVISNNQTEISRAVLVVVREDTIYRDDYYITTGQNVIMTQAGAEGFQLNMQLVNGSAADANGFEWVIDNSTIITVESAHGMVKRNRAVVNSVFNAIALIVPKKAGTAKITVSHPKSETTATVIVKVYPKGTFVKLPVLVGTEGLIEVIKGTPKTVHLRMVSGDILDAGSLDWKTVDTDVAAVNTSAHGMVNILTGASEGLTRLIVNGDKLEAPHESLVLAGTPEYIDQTSVIYVDTIYQKLVTEQIIRLEVKDSQNKYNASNDFTAAAENKDILYAVMIKNQLVLQGKNAGETRVRIAHPDAINDLSIHVRVDPANINIDKPYYISGPEMKGIVRGINGSISVSLVGSSESEEGRLRWSIDDASVAGITANGRECMITGYISNRQTKIRVSHPKAEHEKVILVYVTENVNDLYNKVAIGLENEHYLLTKGEEQLITLITNANEDQKLGLTWKVQSGSGIITIDPYFDSAMIRAVGVGNAEITVTHGDNLLPAVIYVSVVEALSTEKMIKGPALIELLTGESRIIPVSHLNLSQSEINNIQWSVEDLSIANIDGNGDSAYLLGLRKGVSCVNIRQDQIGYRHRAALVCADTPEELASVYIMGVESTYHTMTVGDEKKVQLIFGSAGFPEAEKSKIRWTAANDDVIRVAGSGETATVVAVNEGRGTVTVTSDASLNSIELIFEVRGNKAALYEIRGYEKIIGMVVGDTRQAVLKLFNGNEEILNGYSLLEYENENDGIIGINTVGNIIDITAKAAGQSYITARHRQVNEPARILVYTANTREELDLYYPIAADKTNYLIQAGESVTVRINTIEMKDKKYLHDVQWGIENSGCIENPVFNGKKEAVIKGKSAGQCIININYQGKTVERIFITVVENNVVDMTKYIVTESIIGMVKGTSRDTVIYTNLGAGESGNLIWESTNTDVVTVSGNGTKATITAGNTSGNNNEAYITVSCGSWLKRHILVYVCEDETQVKNYKAMNMENQYYRMGRNEQMVLPLFYAPNKPDMPTLWVDKYDNKVVKFNPLENGAKLEITALNEGVAVLEAVNTGLSNSSRVLRICIEVSDRYVNTAKIPVAKYLTTLKTIYILNPDEPEAYADISVNGIGMTVDEMNKVQWAIESGNQFISIYPNGKDCKVKVNQAGLEGEAGIKAYFIDNIVHIKIIVSRNRLVGFPHIIGDDVIRMGLHDNKLIEYNVAEAAAYDKNLFAVTVVNGMNIVNVRMNGNMLEVEGKSSGQALLRISCNTVCRFAKEVMVMVTSTPDGLAYLTTRDNFNVVKLNEYKTLNVEMAGFDHAGDQGYTWKLDENSVDIISLDYSGRQAQIQGKKEGTAKITVNHDLMDPSYSLVLYVRVQALDADVVYLTTQKNIVTVIEDRTAYIEAELIGGRPEDNNLFVWESINDDVIRVDYSGNQAVVFGKQPGTGKVKIKHEAARNKEIEVLIIVEKDTTSQGIYITTDNVLIDMKPNEMKKVSVRLAGGNPEDVYGFGWSVRPDYESVDKVNGKNKEVIRLAAEKGEGNYVTAVNEGVATIMVTHPKTSYVLEIKVYVRLYNSIRFKQRNAVIYIGQEAAHIEVECPSGVTVIYTASQYRDPFTGVSRKVVNVSGTNNMCVIEGIAEGVCVVNASDARGTNSDEIIIEVRKTENRLIRYIQTPDIIYNMTDWQSSLNRAMISGTTIGEKNDGQMFSGIDDSKIQWRISGGSDIVGFGYNAPNVSDKKLIDTGKTVSVYANKAGEADITLTHPDMPEYEKKVYVRVSAYDANFRIEPLNISMQVNETQPIEAIISNLPEIDYSQVRWEVGKNEYGKDGVSITENNGNKTIRIKALSEGICQVKSTFNNTTTLMCNVYVEKKKSLTIKENYITILPNEIRDIGYSVEPAGSEVKINTDYNEFIEIMPGYPKNGILRIKGKEREGLTQVTLTSNYIEKMITVNTNYNYTFSLKGKFESNGSLSGISAVRGRPGETITLAYDVFPKKDPVKYINDTGYYYKRRIVSPVNVDSNNQRLSVRLDNCGYSVIEYESEYNKNIGLNLKIPVYVYYPVINLKWQEDSGRRRQSHNGNYKSRVDTLRNAIYIADHEELSISYQRSGNFPAGYPGADLVMAGDKTSNTVGDLLVDTDEQGVTIIDGTKDAAISAGSGSDSLIKVEYAGLLKIVYTHSTGGETLGSFEKKFMVYKEKWARK